MKSPFPTPAIQFILKECQPDPLAVSLASALDTAIGHVAGDISGMRDWLVPEACASSLVDELAYELGVDILRTDSEETKRAKIANGVKSQKYKGLWVQDVYPRIKNITGVAPVLTVYLDEPLWILLGANTGPVTWSIFGTDGVDTETGFDLQGSGTELGPGSVQIDIGAGQSANVVRIVEELRDDVCPAYYIITLGYMSAGVFIPYAGGQF